MTGLREQTIETARRALARGTLQPIETSFEVVEDGGVAFVVRILDTVARKRAAAALADRPPDPARGNPFLPPHPDLVVADLSPTHVAVLNRFPALEEHLLVIPRAFEEQAAPLHRQDLEALAACFSEIDGLAFYNGGAAAGASQRHKHLQVIPRALGPHIPQPPIEAVLDLAHPVDAGPAAVARTPFRASFCRLPPGAGGAALLERYEALLAHAGIAVTAAETGPYNLLVARGWMLAIPRAREEWEGISINALGFAGALLARDAEEARRLREGPPMRVLASVAGGLALH